MKNDISREEVQKNVEIGDSILKSLGGPEKIKKINEAAKIAVDKDIQYDTDIFTVLDDELYSYENTTSYTNALLEEHLEQLESLQFELEEANEKIMQLQSHLKKEKEERLEENEENKKSSLIDRSVAIISVVIAIISLIISIF